jgi:hypothetical protein
MAPQKLKIAAAGLGRMGKRHAINFLNRTPRAELVAAFTPDPTEMAWAKVNLEPHGVTLYDDYQKMIEQEGLQAVVIGTATSVHAEEAIQAMQKNLHVLCEKPLSTSIEVVSRKFPVSVLQYRLTTYSAAKSSMKPRNIPISKLCVAFPAASTSHTETHSARPNKVPSVDLQSSAVRLVISTTRQASLLNMLRGQAESLLTCRCTTST